MNEPKHGSLGFNTKTVHYLCLSIMCSSVLFLILVYFKVQCTVMLTMLANITAIVEKYKMSHYYEKMAAFVILVTLKQNALFAIY